MSYRVVMTREVEGAIDARVVHLKEQGAGADRLAGWLSGLLDLIDSLAEWPRRFALAEAVSVARGSEVRRANYSDYAVFFRVDEARKVVEVIAFRHGRQRPPLEG